MAKVPFFMCLLHSVAEMMGPEMAKGILERNGQNVADALINKFGEESLNVPDLESLVNTKNPLNFFDDTLGISDGKLFILEKCPFLNVLLDFLDLHDGMTEVMNAITKSYNADGNGYAVSPFCVVHQTFRSEIAKHIKVNGKPVELMQLGCRAYSGKIEFAKPNLDKLGMDEATVDSNLKDKSCMYTIKEE